MYSAYLFDFDYTLADATNGIVKSVNYALKQMNLPMVAKEEIRKTIGMHLRVAYSCLTHDENTENQSCFLRLFKQKADEVMLDNTKLFENTEGLLKNLKNRQLKTAIVSTKPHYRIRQVLSKYDISHLIDVIVGGEDVVNFKPHPEPLERAFKLLNVPPENCLYIGDSLIDAQTALRANVDFIAVTTGTTKKEEFCKFPYVEIFGDLKELADHLLQTQSNRD